MSWVGADILYLAKDFIEYQYWAIKGKGKQITPKGKLFTKGSTAGVSVILHGSFSSSISNSYDIPYVELFRLVEKDLRKKYSQANTIDDFMKKIDDIVWFKGHIFEVRTGSPDYGIKRGIIGVSHVNQKLGARISITRYLPHYANFILGSLLYAPHGKFRMPIEVLGYVSPDNEKGKALDIIPLIMIKKKPKEMPRK